MADERELLTNRIILNAMLPVLKVAVADDPAMKKRFAGVNARIQFKTEHGGEPVGACLVFTDGALQIQQGCDEPADIVMTFKSVAQMNAMFSGKFVIPGITGFNHPVLLIKVFSLLMSLKILLPDVRPKDPNKQWLKVKMAFYMITTALSQYNKGGDPEMNKWTQKQPERIYQITVDPGDIAAYLRVKAGKSKAGRGVYKRRRPFVHLKFNGVEGAFPIVMNDVDMVEAIKKGYLTIEGSPEYGRDFGDFMMRIQSLVT